VIGVGLVHLRVDRFRGLDAMVDAPDLARLAIDLNTVRVPSSLACPVAR